MEWTATTRFANLSRRSAWTVLGLLAALILFGLWSVAQTARLPPSPPSRAGDLALHRGVVQRVRAGEAYETAAVAEHRARGYPVRPFLAVRPPWLAMFLSQFPNERTTDGALVLLAIGTIAAWATRLYKTFV